MKKIEKKNEHKNGYLHIRNVENMRNKQLVC